MNIEAWDVMDSANYGGGTGGFAGPGGDGYFDDLSKALTAGGQTAGLLSTGGRALVLEDLESTLRLTTFGEKQFASTLFYMMKSNPTQANGLVHEFTTMNDYGETGAYSPEISTTLYAIDVELSRGYVQMRFCRTKRQVSKVTRMVKTTAKHEALQIQGGTRFLVSHTETTLFEGDTTMVPDEFNGLHAIGRVQGGIVNMGGQGLLKDAINNGALSLVNANGVPSHLFMPMEVQNHLDRNLIGNQDRIVLGMAGVNPMENPIGYDAKGATGDRNAIMAGAPMAGFRSSYGNIMFRANRFTKRRPLPYKPNILGVPTEVATSPSAPVTPTGVIATANAGGGGFNSTGCGGLIDASGNYSGVYAGTYSYRISAENSNGESVCSVAVSATVAANGNIALVWNRMATATAYRIYRSRNGTGGTDAQYIKRVTDATASNIDSAVTYPGGTTVQFIDTNQSIAGCFTAYMLDLDSPGELKTLDWVQLAPMTRDILPPADTTFQWIQFLFGAICVYAPGKMTIFENIGIN